MGSAKGDGAHTLARDSGVSLERAKEIMANTFKANSEGNNMGIYIDKDGVEKSKVDPGDIVIIPEQVEAIERIEVIKDVIDINEEELSGLEPLERKLVSIAEEKEEWVRIKSKEAPLRKRNGNKREEDFNELGEGLLLKMLMNKAEKARNRANIVINNRIKLENTNRMLRRYIHREKVTTLKKYK